MLPKSDAPVWMDAQEDEAVSWPPHTTTHHHPSTDDDDEFLINSSASLSSFRSMLDPDSSITNPNPFYHPEFTTLLFNPLDNNSSPSHPHLFPLDPSSHHIPSLFPPKSLLPSFFNNSFDNAFDLACDPTFFPPQDSTSHPIFMGFNSQFPPISQFPPASRMLPFSQDTSSSAAATAIGGPGASNPFSFEDFDAGAIFPNRSKVLRPLEVLPPLGAEPTLFQKRAALRQSSGLQTFGTLSSRSDEGLTSLDDTGGIELHKKRKRKYEDEVEDMGADISTMNYDSDDPTEKLGVGSADNGGDNSNVNSSITVGDQKGKKKGMPAKNLMAERRRRKKLNDRLYMLRSVVPKISKLCKAHCSSCLLDQYQSYIEIEYRQKGQTTNA